MNETQDFKLSMIGFSISGIFIPSRRFYFCVSILFLLFIFGTATSSAQDLGALARQEQARKDAQPVHATHVYTNDDLARPKILAPEDQSEFASKRIKVSPMPAPETPAAEVSAPEIASPEINSTPEVSAAEISLGEVARQYQKQKMARKMETPAAIPSTVATHVYSNDDLVRDQILTPEDTATYNAALEKPVPVQIETPAETSVEKEAGEVAMSETPLGDLARAVYQQAKRELEEQVAATLRVPKKWATLAAQVSKSVRPERSMEPYSSRVQTRRDTWNRSRPRREPAHLKWLRSDRVIPCGSWQDAIWAAECAGGRCWLPTRRSGTRTS